MSSNQILRKTLSEIALEIKRGLSSYYVQDEGLEIPFINIKDLQQGFVVKNTVDKVKIKETSSLDKSRIEPNDVLISVKGSTFRAALADESVKDFVISENIIAIKLKDQIKPELLVAYLNSPFGQKELKSRGSGSFQKSLNLKILENILIPIPSLEKQKIIVDYLSLLRSYILIEEKEKNLRKKITDQIIMNIMEEK